MYESDMRYFKRNEPTILGLDFMTFLWDNGKWLEWDTLETNRRTYEPIEDEI